MRTGIEFDDSPSPCRRAGGSLVACPDCSRDVSRRARACVHCGRPRPGGDRRLRNALAVGTFVTVGLVLIATMRPCDGHFPLRRHESAWGSALRARPEGSGFLGVTLRAPCEIAYVASASPADEAGLRSGDRIHGIDGRAVTHWRAFLTELWTRKPGDRVTLRLTSDGAVRLAEVTLSPHPDD